MSGPDNTPTVPIPGVEHIRHRRRAPSRATAPITPSPDDLRGIHRRIAAARTEARSVGLILLVLIVAGVLGGIALRRADMAELRLQIQKRSKDRITSEQVHRLLDLHSRQPHKGAVRIDD